MCANALINQYISESGITYEFIAEKTAIPVESISKMLSSEQKMLAEEYFLICNALNVPLTEFYNEYE